MLAVALDHLCGSPHSQPLIVCGEASDVIDAALARANPPRRIVWVTSSPEPARAGVVKMTAELASSRLGTGVAGAAFVHWTAFQQTGIDATLAAVRTWVKTDGRVTACVPAVRSLEFLQECLREAAAANELPEVEASLDTYAASLPNDDDLALAFAALGFRLDGKHTSAEPVAVTEDTGTAPWFRQALGTALASVRQSPACVADAVHRAITYSGGAATDTQEVTLLLATRGD